MHGIVQRAVATLGLAGMLISGAAHAHTSNGKITKIEGAYYGSASANTVVIYFQSWSGSGCAAPVIGYGFDATTTRGKNMLSMLLAAFLAGRVVQVTGATSCINIEENTGSATLKTFEELRYFTIVD